MRVSVVFLISLLFTVAHAQQLVNPAQRAQRNATIIQKGDALNLQQALSVALEKNYQIRVSRSQEQIARLNTSYGNAGFLPLVTANAQINPTLQNIRQSYFSAIQPDQRLYGINNRSSTAGVNMTWTVFND